MPDKSLPPVGELVLVTDQQGQVSLGYESKNWLERLGKPPIRLADVQSWCRVLVLPDTEETRQALRRELRTQLEAMGIDSPDSLSLVLSNSVWRAVRGAAIR